MGKKRKHKQQGVYTVRMSEYWYKKLQVIMRMHRFRNVSETIKVCIDNFVCPCEFDGQEVVKETGGLKEGVRISISLPKNTRLYLDDQCLEYDLTPSEVVRQAIKSAWLDDSLE